MKNTSNVINVDHYIETRDVSFAYGTNEILKNVTFDLFPGETLALIGPNGAGKTTLLSLLQGIRKPKHGEIKIMGWSPRWSKVRFLTGVVIQEVDFPAQITPREVFAFASAHFPDPQDIEAVIEKFDLSKLVDRKFSGFSVGEKRRVAIAMAFIGNPKLIYLDEPTAGLDTAGQDRLFENIREFQKNGGSLVLTSHVWNDIETLADRVLVLDNGQLILSGTTKEIGSRFTIRKVSFQLMDETALPNWLKDSFELKEGVWSGVVDNSDGIVRRLCSEGVDFKELQVESLGLRAAIEAHKSS